MFLVGSLFRRLAPGDGERVRVDEDRERYMWTRMREHLALQSHMFGADRFMDDIRSIVAAFRE